MAGNGKSSPVELLAVAVASGRTVKAAAHELGIGERTAYRHTAKPEFRERVLSLRREMLSATVGKLTDSMTEAADVLRKQLASEDESIAHKAAVRVIELGIEVVETLELESRISECEERLNRRQRKI